MSLSRTPSPRPTGGWSSPGLTAPHDFTSGPTMSTSYAQSNGHRRNDTWAAAQSRSSQTSYPSFSTQRQSFFRRALQSLAWALPRNDVSNNRHYAEKEKLSQSRRQLKNRRRFPNIALGWKYIWRARSYLVALLLIMFLIMLSARLFLHRWYVRSSYGGDGKKFVIIMAYNVGGGVMEWKGPKQWAIERDSLRNKKAYAKKWGYDLEVVDMTTKKKYAHEWRESWEKVDVLKRCLNEYPDAEWFWWLDLNTFIMEPTYSLQTHMFNDLLKNTYRDINEFNPLNITHPLTDVYLDLAVKSLNGDGKADSINLILSQDCGGFNLGSFFIRRSTWTDRLLDIWWDPVMYDQRHMDWEHKEQDALEHLYTHHPWVRPHIAFMPQRKANSFPSGACGSDIPSMHYDEKDRDFVVNMAGCEFGRDCWAEMYRFRELSTKLNRPRYLKARDRMREMIAKLFGKSAPPLPTSPPSKTAAAA